MNDIPDNDWTNAPLCLTLFEQREKKNCSTANARNRQDLNEFFSVLNIFLFVARYERRYIADGNDLFYVILIFVTQIPIVLSFCVCAVCCCCSVRTSNEKKKKKKNNIDGSRENIWTIFWISLEIEWNYSAGAQWFLALLFFVMVTRLALDSDTTQWKCLI